MHLINVQNVTLKNAPNILFTVTMFVVNMVGVDVVQKKNVPIEQSAVINFVNDTEVEKFAKGKTVRQK